MLHDWTEKLSKKNQPVTDWQCEEEITRLGGSPTVNRCVSFPKRREREKRWYAICFCDTHAKRRLFGLLRATYEMLPSLLVDVDR